MIGLVAGLSFPRREWPETKLYGSLFAGAVMSFCLARLIGDHFGFATSFFTVAGSATCGWSWLISRALFRAPEHGGRIGRLALVLGMVVAAFLRLNGDRLSPFARMVGNAETLVSSTLLLLAMIEPLRGIHGGMARSELRFRTVFATGYAMLLLIAVIGIDGAAPGDAVAAWSGAIKSACAGLALGGMVLAIRYRADHPFVRPHRQKRHPATADESDLGSRLIAMMGDEAVYTLPALRVADVARRLGEAEYKVTRCITGTLGFRNFSHMVNHVRVAEAKRRFADAACDRLPILTIALDCGFGSIGPFNRAFKAETGVTPLHFRKAARAAR